ncbi:MAG: hypothetical protein Q8P80_02055 [Candidatus Levybacteria bacterium]|nr:hypothetical protein [Candidatus Levybacteria bacterium]
MEEKFLPKEPLDLPRESDEIPARTSEDDAYENNVRTLLSWSSPGRPFRRRGKQFFLSGLLIMLLWEVLLFLFAQYLAMLVVLSLVFLAFALVTVPPHNFRYRISTEGITIEDHFFLWQELYDFYFKKQNGIEVLCVRTRSFIPGELTITLRSVDKEHVKSVLLSYLPFREVVRPTFMEKSGDWLARNFPLEKPGVPLSQ